MSPLDSLHDPASPAARLAADLLGSLTGEEGRIRIDPETVEQDLARLVLGLMAFLRELMELQAIRRMEAGTLTAAQEETLGATLMRAEEALHKTAAAFGLRPQDLSLDLGLLGRTI
jgi:hypothetical protein